MEEQLPKNRSHELNESALRLLQFEAEIRKLISKEALAIHAVNEVRGLIPYDQAIYLRRSARGKLFIELISGLTSFDKSSPVLSALRHALDVIGSGKNQEIDFLSETIFAHTQDEEKEALSKFPLRYGILIYLPDLDFEATDAILYLSAKPFLQSAFTLFQRLGETYGHALTALLRVRKKTIAIKRKTLLLVAALCVGALCYPVNLSVIAPAEIVAFRPMSITSPINGVIRKIEVEPGSSVKVGQLLLSYDNIQPRNEMLLAQQKLAVAQAKNSRVSAAAFEDPEASHELATTLAEYELARVNYDYSLEVLERTAVYSEQEGIAIFSDKRDWEGKAVQVGEKILQVADPSNTAVKVSLPVSNSIELNAGDTASVHVEGGPWGGIDCEIIYISYTPKAQPDGITSYSLLMKPLEPIDFKIGVRGSARLSGAKVTLFTQLMRRPINYVRQTLGI